MLTTFQVILIIIMLITFIGVIAEDDRDKVLSLSALCIVSIAAMVASVMWL